MKESDSIEAGSAIIPPFDSPLGKLGMMICFDLRFPEIALALKRQEADVLLYPSAFTPATGKAHWHALLCARAIETECWVIAAAQVGAHNQKRSSYGHSVVISPWGQIMGELGGPEDKEQKGDDWEPELLTVDVDLEVARRMRREVPLKRRTDVYPEV